MKSREIHNVAVIGAGTMGHGIAQVAAQAGASVILNDVSPEFIAKGLERIQANLEGGIQRGKLTAGDRDQVLSRVAGEESFETAVADVDLVIEATPEKEDLKRDLFEKLGRLTPAETILASNTSSLGVARVTDPAGRPAKCVGMHFFNPPHIMKLLEVIRTDRTSEDTLRSVDEIAERMGKQVIRVKDFPGFATSRLGVTLGVEAMRMLEEGVASAEDIDKAMELGYKHPMGPLRLTDLVGLDVRLAILEHLERELGDRFKPPEILRKAVKQGKLGKKTGEGFYSWT
ncbi:MAG: 3-hydroxyacyl-CoA dehydrogenase family protein [Planctomycetota bacterium]|nr:3-hydroxyacyl-CoA dehydrogenase family protein [Planctomycetota bacterium]